MSIAYHSFSRLGSVCSLIVKFGQDTRNQKLWAEEKLKKHALSHSIIFGLWKML